MSLKPDLDEFVNLSKEANIIPVYKEIIGDTLTPVGAYLKLNRKPSFLLESVEGGEKWARYSFVGIEPSIVITAKDQRVSLLHGGETITKEYADPLIAIKEIMSGFKSVQLEGLPRFYGGFVGYIGYDVVSLYEDIKKRPKPALDMPDAFLMFADIILIFDNLKQTIKVVANVPTKRKQTVSAYKRALNRIDKIIETLQKPLKQGIESPPTPQSPLDDFVSNFTKEDFLKAVKKAKDYIYAGDIVQTVLSQRFQKPSNIAPFEIYRTLRLINPSPYMYFIDTQDMQIIGSSPEILVRVEDKKITLRPIAGTRKRGKDEQEDIALAEELKNDPKEIAEHIMLVDLGRNDVGRVAETGTVKVTELMTVEKYSHVMHLVSNVEGLLKEGLDTFDVFRACFPAGTVTGAPKVRAMQIIEELEPTLRGPYAGAVGYFALSGNMDTCITIRTLIAQNGMLFVQAGAGIVADSEPENEWQETVNKAKAMFKSAEGYYRMFT